MSLNIRRFLSLTIIIVIFYFLLKYLLTNWQNIPFSQLQLNLLFLLGSYFLLFGHFVFYVNAWRTILSGLNETLGFCNAFWIMSTSQLAKYMPGGIWFALGRIHIAKQNGLNGTKVALSILIETSLILICGLVLVLVSVFVSHTKSYIEYWWLIILAAGTLTTLHPKILATIINFFLKILKKESIAIPFSCIQLLRMSLCIWGVWIAQIFGFFLLLKTIYPIVTIKFFYIVNIYATSWILGFLAPFAPGGLGVREGIMSLGLSTIMPPGLAIGISFLSRIWLTLFEIIIFGVGLIIRPKKQL